MASKETLADIRRARKLTQEEVARAIGKSVYHVSRIETGAVRAGLDTLKAMATLYKRPLKELAAMSTAAHGDYLRRRTAALKEAS